MQTSHLHNKNTQKTSAGADLTVLCWKSVLKLRARLSLLKLFKVRFQLTLSSFSILVPLFFHNNLLETIKNLPSSECHTPKGNNIVWYMSCFSLLTQTYSHEFDVSPTLSKNMEICIYEIILYLFFFPKAM